MTALVTLNNTSLVDGPRRILDNISLQLEPGKIVSLIGPNGAGKTSLVKLILGLSKPSAGQVIHRPGLKIGYMPQRLTLNTALPLTVMRFLAQANRDQRQCRDSLEKAGAAHLTHYSMHDLSGGETQRVMLARALLAQPQLLVLDEPAQGVDIAGQQAMYQKISDLREDLGCAVLVVSHDLHWVMAKTDTVICLNQHICCHGHPESVSADPAYLTLFGQQADAALAPYHHEHDHAHTIHGDVVEEGCRHD